MSRVAKWTLAIFLTGLTAAGFSALGHNKGSAAPGGLQPPITILTVSLQDCANTAGEVCTSGVKSLKYVSDTGECSFTCQAPAAAAQ